MVGENSECVDGRHLQTPTAVKSPLSKKLRNPAT